MPLTVAPKGAILKIARIGGRDETKRFLNRLGFIVGDSVTIVSELGGNMIISVKDTRVALDKGMANRIMVH